MGNFRKIILAPHDDGGGAFAVLCRLARALLNAAEKKHHRLQIYVLNSAVADGGQARLNELLKGTNNGHEAIFVPTDNLIWLPKNRKTAAVLSEMIPVILNKWVRPLWHSWPCEPNWIRPNLLTARDSREEWAGLSSPNKRDLTERKWREQLALCGNLTELAPSLWCDVALGISMGVPQLHRVARREGFPSVEVGDWFFSVGLRGCMQESNVAQDVIAAAESSLRMIEEDEFKAREAWLTLYQAPEAAYAEYLAGSPVRLRKMTGAIWSGDPLPTEGIENWTAARELRNEIDNHIARVRGVPAEQIRVAYIVTGLTGVWDDIVKELKTTTKSHSDQVAVIDLNRAKGTIMLLEKPQKNEQELTFFSSALQGLSGEERHLATCRASDFGITRSAGGVLGFAETRRPSVLADEPGHWLGRIQREQCQAAGLCVVIPVSEFVDKPSQVIQKQADKLGRNSDLDQTVNAAATMSVGAERDLAEYLFETYIE